MAAETEANAKEYLDTVEHLKELNRELTVININMRKENEKMRKELRKIKNAE